MAKKAYTIQENGQITLPIAFRRKYGLKKGDIVVFKETEEGLLVSPREAMVVQLLDELSEALREKGISLDDLIESGREIRGQMVMEQHGIEPKQDD